MGKRLTAWLLSLALAAALLPGLALPALAAGPQVLTELKLTVMDSVSVEAWGKATRPTIEVEEHWDVFFVQPGKWYRVCDKANLGCDGRYCFEPGTEYYYRFEVKNVKTQEYKVDGSTRIYLDDWEVPKENISLINDDIYINSKTYKTAGARTFLDTIELQNVARPNTFSSPEELAAAIAVPDGKPYQLHHCGWQAWDPDKKDYVDAKDFLTADRARLYVYLTLDEGYGLSGKTQLKLGNSPEPVEQLIRTIPTDESRIYAIRLDYMVNKPEPATLTFDANGGKFIAHGGKETITWETNSLGTTGALKLPDTYNEIRRSGWVLDGWYTQREGGVKVTSDTVYYDDTTLYAHWKPLIEEVDIFMTPPAPGRAPVFYACESQFYETSGQYWETLPETSDAMPHKATDPGIELAGYPEEYLLTAFEEDTNYKFGCTIVAAEGYGFSPETKVYLNGSKVTDQNWSATANELTVVSFNICKEPEGAARFSERPIKIPAGVSGSLIRVDLRDYLGTVDGCTVTGDTAFQASGLSIQDNRYITGTYPAQATGEQTFSLTVASSDDWGTRILTVHMGETQTAPWITMLSPTTEEYCDTVAGLICEVCAPAGAEVTYDWQYQMPDGTYESISQLVATGLVDEMVRFPDPNDSEFDPDSASETGFAGYNEPALYILEINASGTYRCVVTVDGQEVTAGPRGNLVQFTTLHRFGDGQPTADYQPQHRRTCQSCNYSTTEPCVSRYSLVNAPTEGNTGTYRRTCVYCGNEYEVAFGADSMAHESYLYLYGADRTQPERIVNGNTNQYTTVPAKLRPQKEGCSFLGWSLEPDSQRVDYAPGEQVFIAGRTLSSLSLYAVFGQPLAAAQGVSLPGKTPAELQERFGGAVQYTPGTAVSPPTITLTNADITAEVLLAARNAVGLYANSDLNIRLVGTNIIRVNPFEKGIQCDGRLSFSGNGSLYIFVSDETRISDGICAGSIADLPDTVYVGPETDIPEPEGVTVSGTVTSYGSADDPVTVSLTKQGETAPAFTPTLTGASGPAPYSQSYSFSAVPAGEYILKVEKKGHAPWTESITVDSAAIAKDVTVYLWGDVNRDGKVNGTDALWVRQSSAGGRTLDAYQKVLADLNRDGKVNGTDALWIRQISAGSRTLTY